VDDLTEPGVTDSVTFLDQLHEILHAGFMAMTWVFIAMSLLVVGMALHRLVPRRIVDPVADVDGGR